MEKFEKDGVKFTTFERDGELYLCTGSPSGEIEFEYAGEICDYFVVVGATSVVHASNKSSDELYTEWLEVTEFVREHGIQF